MRRWHAGVLLCSLGWLIACEHTTPYITETTKLIGPLTPGDNQLTFNTEVDYDPEWAPDSRAISYIYAQGNVRNASRCFGILPVALGTRHLTFCDDRAGRLDSADIYSGVSLTPDGRVLYLEHSSLAGALAPHHAVLRLADTAAPYTRFRELARLPMPMGDSSVSYLAQVRWTGPANFTAIGARFLVIGLGPELPLDTTPRPLYLIRADLSGAAPVFTRIAGSDHAIFWSPIGGDQLLFARGTKVTPTASAEPFIYRLPFTGGAPQLFATTPGSVPIRGLSCVPTFCLVLAGGLLRLDPATGVFTVIEPEVRTRNWDAIRLSPDGTHLVFRASGNLFLTGVAP